MTTPFDIYLADLQADFKGGKATEYTYRSALEHLLESLADHVKASNDPKHIACGAPDFIVERRKAILGYVETKIIGENLNKVEKSDQLRRYRESLHNLILTDYLEFRWYVNGERRLTARIATEGSGRKLTPDAEGVRQVEQLLTGFYATETPITTTPKDLAQRMAGLTKLVRDLIVKELFDESNRGVLFRQWEAFQKHLIPTLKFGEFADLYAQTMAYGLFAARVNAPDGQPFDRAQAYVYLPPANPFLRKLFLDVGEELDGTVIAPFLDDLALLLKRADMSEIRRDFGRRTRTEDPVVHFYETFLAAYDPALRASRGVYYTPEPVVKFIVNSVDALLRAEFKKPTGLADPDVLLLDPATGTGTFLYYVIRHIYETQQRRGQLGAWRDYVEQHLLKRLNGFELLMAPYAIAHLKLGLLLNELGYTFGKHERLGIYLTNALEQGVTHAETLGLSGYLSDEGNQAAKVKNQTPIMVVTGNPPYSNFGMMNKGAWIRDLLEDYKKDLNEKKINLDDDFIKFIRFGQWRIDQTGQGVLAFITSNTYIDGITHRRMRQSLMESFTDIYILDLHGSSKKKEVVPDGSKDENVFDIQQGVAISIFVKEPGKHGPAKVHHAELWGSRDSKYARLFEDDIATIKWSLLKPKPDQFFFVPKDFSEKKEYMAGLGLTDVFPVWQNGVKTDRDDLFFDFDRRSLESRIKTFYSESGLTLEFRETYRVEDSSSYDLLSKRRKSSFKANNIIQCLYRAFDWRWIYYSPEITSRPGWNVMRHMIMKDNLGLLASRQVIDEFRHALVVEGLANINSIDTAGKFGSGPVFPLYLYTAPEGSQDTLFTTRTPNLAPEFIQDFGGKLGLAFDPHPGPLPFRERESAFTPEDVFHYIYAVLHSPTYRTRYAEFLKIDFPRVPLTSDVKLFRQLVALGAELVDLHLMRSPKLADFITTYPVSGNSEVIKVRHAPSPATASSSRGRTGVGVGVGVGVGAVWINDTQYFGHVPDAVWNFKVGGYQVCDKWLKDRKGRTLSHDDITHYQRIVVALRETLRVMKQIDAVIPSWPFE